MHPCSHPADARDGGVPSGRIVLDGILVTDVGGRRTAEQVPAQSVGLMVNKCEGKVLAERGRQKAVAHYWHGCGSSHHEQSMMLGSLST